MHSYHFILNFIGKDLSITWRVCLNWLVNNNETSTKDVYQTKERLSVNICLLMPSYNGFVKFFPNDKLFRFNWLIVLFFISFSSLAVTRVVSLNVKDKRIWRTACNFLKSLIGYIYVVSMIMHLTLIKCHKNCLNASEYKKTMIEL